MTKRHRDSSSDEAVRRRGEPSTGTVAAVVVESPAKARTVARVLGPGYRVLACYGHVRDLPAKQGSVKPEKDFEMVYRSAGKRASRALGRIRKALEEANGLILATDPDREGEAIAWQVLSWLGDRNALGERPVRRVAFHEMTPRGIRDGMSRPRAVDMDLVHAQQARRALDYLVGFGLSPALWRKIPRCRSAGRVQSVALRLVCEREAGIEAFVSREYWTLEAEVEAQAQGGARFIARPVRSGGRYLAEEADPGGFETQERATEAERGILGDTFTVASVEHRTVHRRPAPPCNTARLQRAAFATLGFGIRRTMDIAQRLYEGVNIGGGRTGLITYMRTDGMNVSDEAVSDIRRIVAREYGKAYLPGKPRVFRSRAKDGNGANGPKGPNGLKNVREAHEAIRPTDLFRTPESLAEHLDDAAVRLYALIRNRAIASQMATAKFDRARVRIESRCGDTVLEATGSRPTFDGFLRVQGEETDAADALGGPGEAAALHGLKPGEAVRVRKTRVERRATRAPRRYTEAGLVRRLETLGIGRPSTYAAILGVLEKRRYVSVEGGRIAPLGRGRVVTAYLESYFKSWIAYGYTARLEEQLDRVAVGAITRTDVLRAFWKPFNAALEAAGAVERASVVAAIEKRLDRFLFGPDDGPEQEAGEKWGEGPERASTDAPDRRQCPACRVCALVLNVGRYGLFVGCGAWPECEYRRELRPPEDADVMEAVPKRLGQEPGTGQAVTLCHGPYGYFVRKGLGKEHRGNRPEAGPKDAGAARIGPKRMSVPPGVEVHGMTLETALEILALPREVGEHPVTGQKILAGIGRYGPWIRHGAMYVALAGDDTVLGVGLDRAVVLIARKIVRISRLRGPKQVLREIGSHPGDGAPVWLKTGHYGPFIAHRRDYASLPDGIAPMTVTLEQALELLESGETDSESAGQPEKRGPFKRDEAGWRRPSGSVRTSHRERRPTGRSPAGRRPAGSRTE